MNSDPISDFLTRIRNASMVNKPSVIVPHSKFKLELSKLLKNEGYISDVKVIEESSKKEIQIDLKYSEEGVPVLAGLNRLSKPGRRLYVGSESLPRNNGGLGTVIISTSRGLPVTSHLFLCLVGEASLGILAIFFWASLFSS